jgi:hypothetical protein
MAASTIARSVLVAAVALFGMAALPSGAVAHTRHHLGSHHARRYARAGGGAVLQCVAFAREDSAVDLPGNAADWWDNAAGVYARGDAPRIGSVLSFLATGRMRLGHVAVVSDVLDRRTLVIDQSHWGQSGVSRDVRVVDVSADNDWSAVRVELGHGGTYGSIYPTHGFIYADRVNGGTTPHLIEAAAWSRPRHRAVLEVAEAPAGGAIDLATPGLLDDAPDRALR